MGAGLVIFGSMTEAVRHESLDGRDYLVAPVVALRQGVLNQELVLAEEYGKYPEAWNGIPITLGHPTERGIPICANTPELVAQSPARLFHVAMSGDRLKGEIWLDVAQARVKGGEGLEALNRLEAGMPVEVSTGYYRDLEEKPGEFEGQPYIGIQRNLRPDHLAILLHEVGACNWQMGCGAPRVNQEEVVMTDTPTVITIQEELSLDDQMRIIYEAFQSAFCQPQDTTPYVREIFPDRVIARFGDELKAIAYEVDADGNVKFSDPIPVEIVYQPVGQQAHNAESCPCAAANSAEGETPAATGAQETPPGSETPAANSALPAGTETAPEAGSNPAPESPPESHIANNDLAGLVAELGGVESARAALESIRQNAENTRQTAITELRTNGCQLTDEDLKVLSQEALYRLRDSLKPADYSGRGLPRSNQRAAALVEAPMPNP